MASVITVGELPKLASRDKNIKQRITTLLKNLSEDWRERKRDWRTGKVISSTYRSLALVDLARKNRRACLR